MLLPCTDITGTSPSSLLTFPIKLPVVVIIRCVSWQPLATLIKWSLVLRASRYTQLELELWNLQTPRLLLFIVTICTLLPRRTNVSISVRLLMFTLRVLLTISIAPLTWPGLILFRLTTLVVPFIMPPILLRPLTKFNKLK